MYIESNAQPIKNCYALARPDLISDHHGLNTWGSVRSSTKRDGEEQSMGQSICQAIDDRMDDKSELPQCIQSELSQCIHSGLPQCIQCNPNLSINFT